MVPGSTVNLSYFMPNVKDQTLAPGGYAAWLAGNSAPNFGIQRNTTHTFHIIALLPPPTMFLQISCGFSNRTSIFPSPKVPVTRIFSVSAPKEGTEGKGSAPLGVRRSFLRFLGDGAFDPPGCVFLLWFPWVFWVAFFPGFLLDQICRHWDLLRLNSSHMFWVVHLVLLFLVCFASVHGQRTCTNTSMIGTLNLLLIPREDVSRPLARRRP